jgi:hypothetical protein
VSPLADAKKDGEYPCSRKGHCKRRRRAVHPRYATAILGGALLVPIENSGYLTDTPSAEGQMTAGALLEVVLAFSVNAIAVMLHPVLKVQDEGLALGYVAARIVEGGLILAATLSPLMVLSREPGLRTHRIRRARASGICAPGGEGMDLPPRDDVGVRCGRSTPIWRPSLRAALICPSPPQSTDLPASTSHHGRAATGGC